MSSFSKKILSAGLFFVLCFSSRAQDKTFASEMVYRLASEEYWGRGYTNDGMHKAAAFLAARFSEFGLRPFSEFGYFQKFNYPVNTFPGRMDLRINGRKMIPGKDFIVRPDSRGLKGKGPLKQLDSVTYINDEQRLLLRIEEKLTWSVAREENDGCYISVLRSSLTYVPKKFSADIENHFVPDFEAANICGYVPGTIRPDSFLFITSHYDHLGGMGDKTYFPGANDNASGVSLLLNLARYYAKHPFPYSIGFILFAGEEAGLLGSRYFTEHPLAPLGNIRFLLNTDLAGTGDEGITVVNATEFPKEFRIMTSLNDSAKWLPAINPRGKAANSDHYHFSEKGVPAFFFYTLGGIKAYHDIYDRPQTLPLTAHERLFQLVTSFFHSLLIP